MAEENVLGPLFSPGHKVHKTSTTATNALSPLTLNARSCVTCRRRKVKCDKKHPCNHCTRQEIECVYPPPGRAPRKARKPQDTALVERLRRLEAVVQTLSANPIEEEHYSVSPQDAELKEQEVQQEVQQEETVNQKIMRMKKEFKELVGSKKENCPKADNDLEDLTERFGTLLVKEGRSRYINPGFWSMFNAEVEDVKGEIDGWSDSEEDENYSSLVSHNMSSTSGFIFSLSSTNVQMSLLHPPADHVQVYWKTYCENVDPLLKMLHPQTRGPYVLKWADKLQDLSKDEECTMFAIYYAAVISTWSEDCRAKFGESKSDLLARYRFGMEQALARANFLQTDSIFVLQSFIIFLTCLRRETDTRSVWCLSALLVRIAQGLGLHRDGSHYPSLPIYKQEMRRLIWWQTVVLDAKLCQDLGSDAGIRNRMYDAKLPRNLNDSDISFEMTELPESRHGCTDMTFNLVRFEIGQSFTKVLKGMHKHIYLQYNVGAPAEMLQEALEKRKHVILDLEKRLEEKYLKDADVSVPINWMTVTMARMLLGKMWLMLYQPFQRRDGGKSLSQETRDQLFKKALECIELSILFHTEARTPRFTNFAWLLQIHTPWQAIAFLLSELCTRTQGPDVERAWGAVDFSMDMSWTDDMTRKERPDAHLWKPLRLLRKKARVERQKARTAAQNETPAFDQTSDTLATQPAPWQSNATLQSFDGTILTDSLSFNVTSGNFHTQPGSNLHSETLSLYSPTGFEGSAKQPSNETGMSNLKATNSHLSIDNPSIELFSIVQEQPSDITNAWMTSTDDVMTGALDNTVPPSVDDANMTWESWDDLVAQWAIQNEDLLHSNGMGSMY